MDKIFIQSKYKQSVGQEASLFNYSEKTISLIKQFSYTNSSLPSLHFPFNHQNLIRQFILLNLADRTDKRLKQGVMEIQYLNGSAYIGQVFTDKDKSIVKRQGKGFYKYQTGDIYLGDWGQDLFHGNGMYLNTGGDAYQGIFYQGNCVFGKIIYSNGDIYEGQMKDGFKNGMGRLRYSSRDKQISNEHSQEHIGEWKMDIKNGRGLYKQRQFIIKGIWENGMLSGQTEITGQVQKRKFEFVGIFSNSEFVKGFLRAYFDQLSFYEGDVFKNNFDGKGRLFQSINTNNQGIIEIQYFGEFKKGKIIGQSSLKVQKAQIVDPTSVKQFNGQSDCDEGDGKGEIFYFNGDFYKGELKRGKKQGKGLYIFSFGDTYQGQFLNDLFHGPGKYFWALNSLSYKGIFSNGAINTYQPGKYSF